MQTHSTQKKVLSIQRLRPKQLIAICNLWMAFPLWFPLGVLLLFQSGGDGFLRLILNPMHWLISLFVYWAYSSLRSLKWFSWYAVSFAQPLVLYEIIWTLAYSSTAKERGILFIIASVLQAFFYIMARSLVMTPYYYPRIRWWESNPNLRLSIPVVLKNKALLTLEADIVDISTKGCFIRTNSPIAVGSKFQLEFGLLDSSNVFVCDGRVVWKTESSVTRPRGIGVRFLKMPRAKVVILKKATQKINRMAKTYQAMARERSWQDFQAREEQFERQLTMIKAGQKTKAS